jgi:hypothetical protein
MKSGLLCTHMDPTGQKRLSNFPKVISKWGRQDLNPAIWLQIHLFKALKKWKERRMTPYLPNPEQISTEGKRTSCQVSWSVLAYAAAIMKSSPCAYQEAWGCLRWQRQSPYTKGAWGEHQEKLSVHAGLQRRNRTRPAPWKVQRMGCPRNAF